MVSMLATTPKPRLVKLVITPQVIGQPGKTRGAIPFVAGLCGLDLEKLKGSQDARSLRRARRMVGHRHSQPSGRVQRILTHQPPFSHKARPHQQVPAIMACLVPSVCVRYSTRKLATPAAQAEIVPGYGTPQFGSSVQLWRYEWGTSLLFELFRLRIPHRSPK